MGGIGFWWIVLGTNDISFKEKIRYDEAESQVLFGAKKTPDFQRLKID